jgi:hypothetical protein
MRWRAARRGVNDKAADPAASQWESEYICPDLPRCRPRLAAADPATPDTPPMRLSPLPLALAVAMAASAAAAQLQNENLLVTMPDGFKMDFQQKTKEMLISEMVPGAESVNDWTQMVTVQIFFGLKSGPDEFKSKVETGWARACRGSSAHAVAQGKENGYPFALWLLACPLNKTTGKPEFTWFKAMQGNDSLYVVQVALKTRPSEETTTRWMDYLRTVRVCDTRLPDRACPAEMVKPQR